MDGPGESSGSRRTAVRGVAIAVVVIAVGLLVAVFAYRAGRGTPASSRSARTTVSTTTVADTPTPVEWPQPSKSEAVVIEAYLSGPGSQLETLRSMVVSRLEKLSPESCSQVRRALAAIDPTAALTAAIEAPDTVLSELFVNLTAEVTATFGNCLERSMTVANDEARHLSRTLGFIAARTAQIKAAAQ